jgi:hypothetical protein
VAECVECKMPAANLAKVFGPTIVGYSSSEGELTQMFAETTKQHKVSLVSILLHLLYILSEKPFRSPFVNIVYVGYLTVAHSQMY